MAAGGAIGFGGRTGLGGQTGYGGSGGRGSLATGGRIGSGGDGAGTVGTGGLGPGGVSGAAGNTVNFVNGRAEGAMTGNGWVSLGELDTVSDPTCAGAQVTSSSPCSTFEWPSNTGLCASGKVPALPASPKPSDNSANWGVLIGADATYPAGGGLGRSFQTITLNFSGNPQTGIRAALHRKGDPDATNYCATVKSGSPVAFAAFNTQCWDGTGVNLSAADLANLDWIGIQVPSASSAIAITNLCLTGITFK